ncbi:hypothetical protein [Streptomyces swartbergensis]|uniref:hypothetical protein n=1 Tax=Streptomyces swartbergensis TaxID=487165 RepID=UPI0037FA71F9
MTVLFVEEQRASAAQTGLQPGMPTNAVLHDVDEVGGLSPADRVLGLVTLGGNRPGDRGLFLKTVVDVVKSLVEEVRYLVRPVDRRHFPARRVELGPNDLRVLNGADASLLGHGLRVGQPPPAD